MPPVALLSLSQRGMTFASLKDRAVELIFSRNWSRRPRGRRRYSGPRCIGCGKYSGRSHRGRAMRAGTASITACSCALAAETVASAA